MNFKNQELELINNILAWQVGQALGFGDEETTKSHAALYVVDYTDNKMYSLMIGSKFRLQTDRTSWDEIENWDLLISAIIDRFLLNDYKENASIFFSKKASSVKFKKGVLFDSCDFLAAVKKEEDNKIHNQWIHNVQYLFKQDNHLCGCIWTIEVDEYQKNNSALHYIAEHDQLTGLYNRHALTHLHNSFDNSIVAMIDIDHFKEVNDEHGHLIGDTALKAVSKKLESVFSHRQNDIIFRLGGDEFLLVCKKKKESEFIKGVKTLMEEIVVYENLSITLSVGYTIFKQGNYRDAIKKADEALYHVKENGRHGYYKL